MAGRLLPYRDHEMTTNALSPWRRPHQSVPVGVVSDRA
jgi:hypothetical protein